MIIYEMIIRANILPFFDDRGVSINLTGTNRDHDPLMILNTFYYPKVLDSNWIRRIPNPCLNHNHLFHKISSSVCLIEWLVLLLLTILLWYHNDIVLLFRSCVTQIELDIEKCCFCHDSLSSTIRQPLHPRFQMSHSFVFMMKLQEPFSLFLLLVETTDYHNVQ